MSRIPGPAPAGERYGVGWRRLRVSEPLGAGEVFAVGGQVAMGERLGVGEQVSVSGLAVGPGQLGVGEHVSMSGHAMESGQPGVGGPDGPRAHAASGQPGGADHLGARVLGLARRVRRAGARLVLRA